MNPHITNTTPPLEQLERLETHLHGSGPPPVTSSRQLFLDAMNRRRVADAAGDVALRDLLQHQAASLYDPAVAEVNPPAVASSTPSVRPLPVSLGEQLARQNATAGPAAPPPSRMAVANHAAPAPVSTTNQEILAQAEASARKSVPGFTMEGYRASPPAAAPLVSGAPVLPPTAMPNSPAPSGQSSALVAGGPRPLPVSLRDQLAGATAYALEVYPAHGSLTPDQIGILRDVPPAERANLPPAIRDHASATSGPTSPAHAPACTGPVPLAPGAGAPVAARPTGPARPLPPSLYDQLSSGVRIPGVGTGAVTTASPTGASSPEVVAAAHAAPTTCRHDTACGHLKDGATITVSTRSIVIDAARSGSADSCLVDELAESIADSGLLHLPTIDLNLNLIGGLHRVRACEKLGLTEIQVRVRDLDEPHRRLAIADENLVRRRHTALAFGVLLCERKAAYLTIHPETAQHRAGGLAKAAAGAMADDAVAPSFTTDTANKTGRSQRSIRQYSQLGLICAEARDVLWSTPIADNLTELLALSRIQTNDDQVAAAKVLAEARAATVAQALALVKTAHVEQVSATTAPKPVVTTANAPDQREASPPVSGSPALGLPDQNAKPSVAPARAIRHTSRPGRADAATESAFVRTQRHILIEQRELLKKTVADLNRVLAGWAENDTTGMREHVELIETLSAMIANVLIAMRDNALKNPDVWGEPDPVPHAPSSTTPAKSSKHEVPAEPKPRLAKTKSFTPKKANSRSRKSGSKKRTVA